jgi:hypothetical protein
MPSPVFKNRAVKILVFAINLLLMGVAVLVMRINDQKKLLQAESDKNSAENNPAVDNSFSNQLPSADSAETNATVESPSDIAPDNTINIPTSDPPAVSAPIPTPKLTPTPTPAPSTTTTAPQKSSTPSNAKTKTS